MIGALILAYACIRYGSLFSGPVITGPDAAGEFLAIGAVSSTQEHRSPPVLAKARHDEFAKPNDSVRLLMELVRLLEGCRPEDRASRIEEFLDGKNTDALHEMLKDDGSLRILPDDLLQSMLLHLARVDAAGAGAYLCRLPEHRLHSELLSSVLTQWGRVDLTAAVDWAKTLKDSSIQQMAFVHLSYRWFELCPDEALAFATINATKYPQLLSTLLGQWSAEQPEAAALWAAEFGTVRGAAGSVSAWAQHDDLAAAEFVLKLPEGRLRHEAAISVMSALAQKDPLLGAKWVDVFPSGAGRKYAIENLVYGWALSDPDSALTWANRLPVGERDTAIFAGAGGLLEARPDLAASWVGTIQDEARRIQQSERVAAQWLKTDRWSAEMWIRSSRLPEQTKLRLLAPGPGGS